MDISDIESAYKHYNNQAEIKNLLKQQEKWNIKNWSHAELLVILSMLGLVRAVKDPKKRPFYVKSSSK